jgi:hypothetical protein
MSDKTSDPSRGMVAAGLELAAGLQLDQARDDVAVAFARAAQEAQLVDPVRFEPDDPVVWADANRFSRARVPTRSRPSANVSRVIAWPPPREPTRAADQKLTTTA